MSFDSLEIDDIEQAATPQSRERAFHARVHRTQEELQPCEVDPAFWNIDPEAWLTLDDEMQRAVAATLIEEDRDAMTYAGIEPDEWVTLDFTERSEVVTAAKIDLY